MAGADDGDTERDGFVAAFDGETGTRAWRTRTVDAYTPDGQLRWSFEMPAFDAGMAAYIMNPRIALAHNRAYISLNDGRVFSLESA